MVRPRVRRRGGRRFVVARRLLRMMIKLFTALIFPAAKALIMWLVTFIRSRVLPVAEVLLRWLATLLIARSIFRNQAPYTVAAIVMRLAFSWIDSILAAINEAPSAPFTGYRGFWHFLRNLPEYRLW
ncbi:hypothetical protein TIFTF001_052414 [Ficus carica]|uniref:Uncharacterized protein n=1 Tax=Ficus carica TaxID=3494 RepID=A0AA88EGR1_FICCA|nr:hypothetical protein TIFTF001_052414 [Ficus carica]